MTAPSTTDRLLAELEDMHPLSRRLRLNELAAFYGEGFAKALERELEHRAAAKTVKRRRKRQTKFVRARKTARRA